MPNRYLLTDYSPAEIAALPDEPLLWWLCWQACGLALCSNQAGDGILTDELGCVMARWPEDWREKQPPLVRDGDRPSLEAILDAFGDARIFIHRIGDAWYFYPSPYSSERWDGTTPYLAACRALLAFKRGLG